MGKKLEIENEIKEKILYHFYKTNDNQVPMIARKLDLPQNIINKVINDDLFEKNRRVLDKLKKN